MFRRGRPVRDPVTITLDGAEVVAERGEPLAAALLAADKTIIARSPKLHRPRAPTCFRGGCDGCLARVDGVPNVMTCLRAAKGGEAIEAQNVIGSRQADLLRVTDWFFKRGIDHHHLMAGVPGLSDVMQTFARKLAGLGRIPSEADAVKAAARASIDALVVGGGPAGIATASALGRAKLTTMLVDDGLTLGGSLVASPSLLKKLTAAAPLDAVEVRSRSVVAGVYEGEALVAGDEGATIVKARAIVFATGAHDGVLPFPGNDLPGVFSARALLRLLSLGLEVDGAVVVVGRGFWSDELARALPKEGVVRMDVADLVAVHGTGGVKSVEARGDRKIKCSVVAVDAAPAPAFEIASQAGAGTRFDSRGYTIVADERGAIATSGHGPKLWAIGECAGAAFDPDAIASRAREVAEDVALSLR